MFSNLLQVSEGGPLSFDECRHPSQRRDLQSFTAVQRIRVLYQPHVVATDRLAELLAGVQLAQRELVVVAVVENIHEVRIKRMDVVQAGESRQDLAKPLRDGLLRELNFTHIEGANAVDGLARVNDRGRSPLRPRQDNIHEVVGRWHLDGRGQMREKWVED